MNGTRRSKIYPRTPLLKRKNFEKGKLLVRTDELQRKGECMAAERESGETTDDRLFEIRQAISAYAQSEKVKSGLIWVSQVADQVAAMDGPGRQQGMRLLSTLAHMVADESDLAGRVTGDRRWHEIGKTINLALVMINSGVPQETAFHLTQALTRVTVIGGQAAALLKANGLF
jgi:hypothetical protein